LKRWIRSLFVTPLIFLVALYTLLEDFLESIVKPVVEHISSWQILQTVEGFLQKRNPYTLFAIYTCKLILFSSIKLLSLYWISQGRGFGAPLLVSGELCGAALTVWYAKVALPALLTLRWFAKAYGKFITVKNRLISKLQQMPAYRYARSKVQPVRQIMRELKVFIVRKRILGKGNSWGSSRVKAVYRLLNRKR
jgi:hypothetical protein